MSAIWRLLPSAMRAAAIRKVGARAAPSGSPGAREIGPIPRPGRTEGVF
jgi:hypothetical protein